MHGLTHSRKPVGSESHALDHAARRFRENEGGQVALRAVHLPFAREERDESVRALALMSGVYDFAPFESEANIRAYLGDDPAKLRAASSVAGLVASNLPVLVCVSEFDTPAFHQQAKALTDALYERDGRCANFLYLPRHNHLSQIAHLNASRIEDRLLADRLAEFVRVHTTPAVPAF